MLLQLGESFNDEKSDEGSETTVGEATGLLGSGLQLNGLLATLSLNQTEHLDDEIGLMCSLSQRGVHENYWPDLPIINQVLYPKFKAELESYC